MIAELQYAADRTLAVLDQISLMWGPTAGPMISLHGLSHDEVHRLHERGGVEDGPSAEYTQRPYIRVRLTSHGGRAIDFFGVPDHACDRCRELLGLPADGVEAAQLAGVVERMEGSGL